MKSSKKDFIIPFEGLKVGLHNYEMQITDAFFEELEYSIIKAGTLDIELELEKKETMLVAEFTIDGNVDILCDRCDDDLQEYIYGEYRIVFKFGEEISDDENLIVLPSHTYELDIATLVYELMTSSLPTRSVHDDGDCNEEMLELINKHSIFEQESDDDNLDEDDEDIDDDDNDDDGPIDPRWEALKKLN